MGSLLAELARWVFDVVHSFGYVGVFVLVLAGSLYLPIPTELTLPLFGFLVGQGRLSLVPVVLTAAAARVSAALIFYALGLRIGQARLRRLIERAERTKLLFGSDLDRASGAFERHGGTAILIGHLIPGVGALISVPAGLKHMPIRWRFLGYTVLGVTLWTGTLIGLGWALGRRWRIVELYASFVGLAVLATVFLGVLWFLWRRWKTRG
ncbi:MAG TPA: DedA family protein [Rubrobacter sp.]|nr:DedA family protein [Rubrobacter sp.]